MNRRSAIKSLSVIAAGAALFPSCSDGLALTLTEGAPLDFTSKQQIWLEAISEAILPKGDKSFSTLESFPSFVSKMINFSSSPKDLATFVNGYNLCTEDMKGIYESATTDLSADQIVDFFQAQLNPSTESSEDEASMLMAKDKKVFCQMIRGLAIEHLVTSKEYQEEVLEFKLVPDTYQACTNI